MPWTKKRVTVATNAAQRLIANRPSKGDVDEGIVQAKSEAFVDD